MTDRNFTHILTELNAAQMRADRAAERVYLCAMVLGLLLAAVCIGAALSLGAMP